MDSNLTGIVLIVMMICAAVVIGFISYDRQQERLVKAGYVQQEYDQCTQALKWVKP